MRPRPVVVGDGFRNPGYHRDRGWLEVLRWKLTARPLPWPKIAPVPPRSAPPAPAVGLAATWVGHATVLWQTPDLAFLSDPIWSTRVGPGGWLGPRRAAAPGLRLESLPPLQAILLSHDHYDHCDLPTLRRLARSHPQARLLAPLGFASLARRAGFAADRVSLLDWWQQVELAPGVVATAIPARHWGNRLTGARNQRLWCGWHVATPAGVALHAGDTAWDEAMFTAIGHHLAAPDLAALPIGAYEPRWFMHGQHCDPAEAVAMHRALGSRRSLAIHWGTVRLTDEGRDDPPARLAAALAAAHLPPACFATMDVGETLTSRPA